MRIILAILGLAILSALVLLLAGPGVRLDIWGIGTGFTVMKWAAYGGIAAGALALLFLLIKRPRGGRELSVAVIALVLGAATLFIPWHWYRKARSVPAIHDITTDTRNPPQFEAVLPLRAKAVNPSEYGGPEVAAQQRAAYPDIHPLMLRMGADSAFDMALRVGRDMGWHIVAADSSQGRIEATAMTEWFGFKDDIVVRVLSAHGFSKLDVRSVSRVGRSDVGKNAERIREYLGRMQKAVGPDAVVKVPMSGKIPIPNPHETPPGGAGDTAGRGTADTAAGGMADTTGG